jgi:hypothetical protein
LFKDSPDHVFQDYILSPKSLFFNTGQKLVVAYLVISEPLVKIFVTKLEGLSQMLEVSDTFGVRLIYFLYKFF